MVRACIAHVLAEPQAHPDVEDATQETLRRAMEHKTTEVTQLRAWTLGIARHVALDVIRRRKRERARQAREPHDAPTSSPLVETVEDTPERRADVQLGEAEERARVRAAMGRLPEGQRQALVLVHLEGLGYAEAAARLGVPLGTIATWIARGRKAIHEELTGQRGQARNT
jgi:RNA polymerase sigma-70 factor (ECF subfamily)